MDRRRFIRCTAGLASVAAGVMFSALPLRAGPATSSGVHWLRFDEKRNRFVSDSGRTRSPDQGRAAPLRISLQGFHPAVSGGVSALDIHALFDRGDGGHWRFLAWHYRSGDRFGSSRGSGFDLDSRAACCLEFAIGEHEDAATCIRTLDLSCAGGLEPGRYLVAITGSLVTSGLPFSGDWSQPLGAETAFDHLLVRVDHVEAGPDLALRVDLACADGLADQARCVDGV